MKKLLLLCLLALPALVTADTGAISFSDGWIKQLPPVVPMRAGYVEIENRSRQEHRIVAFQSSAFERIEMHESLMQDDVMKMVPLETIALPMQGKVALQPGGKHLMLINPQQAMQVGDRVPVTATFEDGSSQIVEFEVRQ